ncbi:MAG: SRPBCC family protein [Candidatus Sericytochromatia bacterium]
MRVSNTSPLLGQAYHVFGPEALPDWFEANLFRRPESRVAHSMLSVERVIAAPSSAVWDVLVDVRKWPVWGPSISSAVLDRQAGRISLGATGRVVTPLGVALPFVITEFDEGRHWAWSVAGVDATRHRVDPLGERSRAIFEVPWWAATYAAVCALALRRIEGMAVERRG